MRHNTGKNAVLPQAHGIQIHPSRVINILWAVRFSFKKAYTDGILIQNTIQIYKFYTFQGKHAGNVKILRDKKKSQYVKFKIYRKINMEPYF